MKDRGSRPGILPLQRAKLSGPIVLFETGLRFCWGVRVKRWRSGSRQRSQGFSGPQWPLTSSVPPLAVEQPTAIRERPSCRSVQRGWEPPSSGDRGLGEDRRRSEGRDPAGLRLTWHRVVVREIRRPNYVCCRVTRNPVGVVHPTFPPSPARVVERSLPPLYPRERRGLVSQTPSD
jgi:hypothetical protein